jgi:hypothetical protein
MTYISLFAHFCFMGKIICNPLALVPPVVIICKFLGCASPPLSFLQVLAFILLFFIVLRRFLFPLSISLLCVCSHQIIQIVPCCFSLVCEHTWLFLAWRFSTCPYIFVFDIIQLTLKMFL